MFRSSMLACLICFAAFTCVRAQFQEVPVAPPPSCGSCGAAEGAAAKARSQGKSIREQALAAASASGDAARTLQLNVYQITQSAGTAAAKIYRLAGKSLEEQAEVAAEAAAVESKDIKLPLQEQVNNAAISVAQVYMHQKRSAQEASNAGRDAAAAVAEKIMPDPEEAKAAVDKVSGPLSYVTGMTPTSLTQKEFQAAEAPVATDAVVSTSLQVSGKGAEPNERSQANEQSVENASFPWLNVLLGLASLTVIVFCSGIFFYYRRKALEEEEDEAEDSEGTPLNDV